MNIFMKPIFTKIITGVRGILLGKTWQNFEVYIPLPGVGVYSTSNICETIYQLYKMHQNLKQYEKNNIESLRLNTKIMRTKEEEIW